MARTSRYRTENGTTSGTRWNVALYLRLSRDDGDKAESDSIENQRDLLSSFLKQNEQDLTLYHIYSDDGYTGTNFDRPDFQKMLADIKTGHVNCVVVKDLSRIGRDYINVGDLLENVFPENNVRFISLNDGVDTAQNDSGAFEFVPYKNLMNQHYAADISKKVRSALDSKRYRGEFIGSFACYGYLKDKQDKNHLVIDETAAPVVRRIFDEFTRGTAKLTIAYGLNKDGIPCPSEYKKQQGLNYVNPNRLESTVYWTHSTINRILKNEVYIGNMVQKTQTTRNYKSKRKLMVDQKNQIRVEHTHEPIIDMDTWNAAKDLLHTDVKRSQYSGDVHKFAGIVKCADCGRAMNKRLSYDYHHNKYYFLVCGTYKQYGKTNCSSHSIKYSTLEEMVLTDLKNEINKYLDIESYLKDDIFVKRQNAAGAAARKRTDEIQRTIAKKIKFKDDSYFDYKEGVLKKEDFLRLSNTLDDEIAALNNELYQIKQEQAADHDAVESYQAWADMLKKYRDINELTREIIVATIKKIIVYEDKSIQIDYKFNSL